MGTKTPETDRFFRVKIDPGGPKLTAELVRRTSFKGDQFSGDRSLRFYSFIKFDEHSSHMQKSAPVLHAALSTDEIHRHLRCSLLTIRWQHAFSAPPIGLYTHRTLYTGLRTRSVA